MGWAVNAPLFCALALLLGATAARDPYVAVVAAGLMCACAFQTVIMVSSSTWTSLGRP